MRGKNDEEKFEAKATEWTFDRIKEAFEQVAQDEAENQALCKKSCSKHGLGLEEKGETVGGAQPMERNTIGSNQTVDTSCAHVNVNVNKTCVWWNSCEVLHSSVETFSLQMVRQDMTQANEKHILCFEVPPCCQG